MPTRGGPGSSCPMWTARGVASAPGGRGGVAGRSEAGALKRPAAKTREDAVHRAAGVIPRLFSGRCSAAGTCGKDAAGQICSSEGMNFLAGYLILVTRSEEESFWLLDALVGRILPDYYSPSMLGLKTDQEVLGELVRTKLPAVAALMDSHGLLWTLVVSRWFICLFVDVLPVETVLRIWDCLFNEGSKIIFRVALTLIKEHQALILEATSVPDICEKFKDITRGSFVTECHTFMRVKTQPKCKEICAVYGEGAVTAGTCQKWFAKFRAGDFSLDEAPQSSRPVEADSDQIETL
ncbi:growth hormone-regulated TBC protein 1 isoform X6 [Orcinus orca]|uniref:growth hormone-regulated TBC protein 1 isoform X6 n=1 Tax=Orcinus orca TaxID=9733 RepID=UPI001440EF2D|nr:growth hormone-regulated TBC protein 1 isoform X6 [Orcinus orca]